MNVCNSCGEDFGSVGAFNRHRVGKHEYTFAEGLRMDPVREDGRRCLATSEMTENGWNRDSRGRWRQPVRIGRPALRRMLSEIRRSQHPKVVPSTPDAENQDVHQEDQ